MFLLSPKDTDIARFVYCPNSCTSESDRTDKSLEGSVAPPSLKELSSNPGSTACELCDQLHNFLSRSFLTWKMVIIVVLLFLIRLWRRLHEMVPALPSTIAGPQEVPSSCLQGCNLCQEVPRVTPCPKIIMGIPSSGSWLVSVEKARL